MRDVAEETQEGKTLAAGQPSAPAADDRPFVILCLGFAKGADAKKVSDLKEALIASPMVINCVESTGAFDMVLEIGVSDPATYYRWLLGITGPYGGIIAREEVCFGNRPLAEENADIVVWVPDGDGTLGLRRGSIVKITAEGDYMRVHSEDRSWVVHATMQSFEYLLEDGSFLQIHRSTMVRLDAVERISRQDGYWALNLTDGSEERIARSRVRETRQALRARSTPNKVHSSN